MVDGSDDLERLSREELILKARVLGVERPELMTRVEMRDEIVRRSVPDPVQQRRARGFLGVARDLVASVVEAGLNLPDAAAIIRGEGAREGDWKGPPPVATVTLAEIYAAQGHLERALRMLDEVLAQEPDHDAARSLRDRLASGTETPKPAAPRRQRVSFADPPEADITPPPAPAPAPAPESVPATESAPDPVADTRSAPQPAPPAPEPEIAAIAAQIPATPEPVVSVPVPVVSVPVPVASVPVPVASVPVPVASVPVSAPQVITLAHAGQRQVYWELPPHTLDALKSRAPQGRALVRVISFRTRAGKVERRAHDVSPSAEVGSAVLPGLNADAVVRAVLGWEAEGRFMPFVVASDLAPERFRAHPLVGSVLPEVEQRALQHLSRRLR
ncbi:MAG: tetratricopeptide repeat protein [Polyangiaceae bacterium]